jgi:Holliday junction DNA helicase RuvA
VIVDVGGVGYDVKVPVSTFMAVGEVGGDVTLRIHTHVREDQIALYGFHTAFELSCFERLIDVSGVGPRLALAVLSGIEAEDLVHSVQRGDVARLTAIPGIGKKTAERITLELRDRLPLPAARVAAPGGAAGEPDMRADLVSALVNLGYPRPQVEKAVDRARAGVASPVFDATLRAALKELSSSP